MMIQNWGRKDRNAWQSQHKCERIWISRKADWIFLKPWYPYIYQIFNTNEPLMFIKIKNPIYDFCNLLLKLMDRLVCLNLLNIYLQCPCTNELFKLYVFANGIIPFETYKLPTENDLFQEIPRLWPDIETFSTVKIRRHYISPVIKDSNAKSTGIFAVENVWLWRKNWVKHETRKYWIKLPMFISCVWNQPFNVGALS